MSPHLQATTRPLGSWLWLGGLALLNVMLLWVVAGRIASDESRRMGEGLALADEARAKDSAWLTQVRGGASLAPGEEEKRDLLGHPPPSPNALALGLRWALAHQGASDTLTKALEDNPLGALRWWRPLAQGPAHPWGESILQGALLQGALGELRGPRPAPSTLGRLRMGQAASIESWCREGTPSRRGLSICRGRDIHGPEAIAVLGDESIPPQGAVLYGAARLPPSTLAGVVMGDAYSDRQRRLGLLAYGQHGPDPEIEGQLIAWLASEEVPFLPVLAALECLRLGVIESAPIIRAAALTDGSVESLAMVWAADLLEDEAFYRRASVIQAKTHSPRSPVK